MANGPEPEPARHAPRTSSHTSLKQEHQRPQYILQKSESPTAGHQNKAQTPIVFPFRFHLSLPRSHPVVVFGLFEFLKYFLKNLLKKLCLVYFLHFVKIIHHLGFCFLGGLFEFPKYFLKSTLIVGEGIFYSNLS